MLNKVKDKVAPMVGNTSLFFQRNAPELYLAGGIVTGISAAVLFARAHKRSDDVLDDIRGQIEAAKAMVYEENVEAVEKTGHELISQVDEQKMLAPLYRDFAVDLVKLYGPAFVMGATSIALLLTGHGVLRNRNRALVSTVALVERGFATYRARVVEELGAEADERFYYGAEQRDVVTIEEGKDGKTKKKRSKRNHIAEMPAAILYGRVFDSTTTPRWSPDRDRNEFFLRSSQDTMNHKLKIDGHVFLNDVYKELGFKRTAVGAVVGWCNDLPGGDGVVSFGLDKSINLDEGDNRWMLDFNVQGNILDGLTNEAAPEW